jgi:uncharacterized protein YprB with RNaseH-like and TPR domain
MLSQAIQEKLARLHRRSASMASTPVPPRLTGLGSPDTSTKALPKGREVENPAGRHWLVEEPLNKLWRGSRALVKELPEQAVTHSRHRELAIVKGNYPCRTIFIDLETCGFAGSAVFLIGVIRQRDQDVVLSQLLARNYAEEPAILQTFWEYVSGQHALISFNGKSFDWPMLVDRTTLHRLPFAVPKSFVHCDLLHHARRIWRDRLANCRLQTLERHVCGRRRVDDIAGRDIPRAYHDYVRRGDAWELRSILRHNAWDLVTLVQLTVAMMHAT